MSKRVEFGYENCPHFSFEGCEMKCRKWSNRNPNMLVCKCVLDNWNEGDYDNVHKQWEDELKSTKRRPISNFKIGLCDVITILYFDVFEIWWKFIFEMYTVVGIEDEAIELLKKHKPVGTWMPDIILVRNTID